MTASQTVLDCATSMAPADVLAAAKKFFPSRPSLYAAYPDKEGPGFCTFRGQGGEEIVIAAVAEGVGSRVTGSSYLFDMQVSRFFATLPRPVLSGVEG